MELIDNTYFDYRDSFLKKIKIQIYTGSITPQEVADAVSQALREKAEDSLEHEELEEMQKDYANGFGV